MIHGLDITADYQQYPWKKIDWPALKADPLNFRFIWVKLGEATECAAYLDGAKECAVGALSVKFEAINFYHYYWYQWQNALGVWTVIPAKDQAKAFYDAWVASGIKIAHPMTDCEDPLIGQFCLYSYAGADAAIAFARKLNAHLKAYHQAITDLFGVRPDIYTGKYWLDYFCKVLILNGYQSEIAWMKDYKFIFADYDGVLNIPDYITGSQLLAWQVTSTPVPPVQGIPTGRIVPGDALDIDVWMGTDTEFMTWSGQEEVPVTAKIYNEKVILADRAWVMEVKTDQSVKTPYKDLGVDAIVLPMVGMPWDGSHQVPTVESTFSGRFKEINAAGVPVFGKVVIDAGFVTTEQHTKEELDGHSIWQNLVVTKILDAWHIGAWSQSDLKPADFYPIEALVFEQISEMDHRSPARDIEEFWQAHFHRYVVDKLRVLMAVGAIPTVPIILKTTPEWLQKYMKAYNDMLHDGRQNWLYLSLYEQKLDSTNVFNDLWGIYQFATWDDFVWPYVPDGYASRVLLFEFSADKQKLSFVQDKNGNPSTVNLYKWCDTAGAMNSFLAITPPVVITPSSSPSSSASPSPSVEIPSELEERVSTLESEMSGLYRQLATNSADIVKLEDTLSKVVEWITSFK